jgi:hypothetical protein
MTHEHVQNTQDRQLEQDQNAQDRAHEVGLARQAAQDAQALSAQQAAQQPAEAAA